MIDSGAVAVAYETVELPSGELPLLTPMSRGGRPDGGAGGRQVPGEGVRRPRRSCWAACPGVAPGKVVILGGGVVGINAAKMAAGLGAHVTILDISLDRLRYLDDVMPANVDTDLLQPPQHPRGDPPGRPGDRRGAAARRQGAAPGQARRPQADEAGLGDRGRGGGPGRLRRDHQADHAREPDLLRGRHPALRRGEHAGRRAAHLDARAHQRHAAVRDSGWPRRAGRPPARTIRALRLGLNVVEGKVVYPGVAEAFELPLVDVGAVL